jgi:hypothetical protein
MAEVSSEEISSLLEVWLTWSDNLSFVPFTFINTSFFVFGISASFNDFPIFGHELWSTEVSIWYKDSTIAPSANIDIAVAFVLVALFDTLVPLVLGHLGSSNLNWVAESSVEEWLWSLVNWLNSFPCTFLSVWS